jgi:hypothetical protein
VTDCPRTLSSASIPAERVPELTLMPAGIGSRSFSGIMPVGIAWGWVYQARRSLLFVCEDSGLVMTGGSHGSAVPPGWSFWPAGDAVAGTLERGLRDVHDAPSAGGCSVLGPGGLEAGV